MSSPRTCSSCFPTLSGTEFPALSFSFNNNNNVTGKAGRKMIHAEAVTNT